jgi:anti-sigma-K factor RskA
VNDAPTDTYTDREHPELAFAPAYALGALDDGERATFEAHLATCEACAAEVRAHGEVASLLPYALMAQEPPAGLRARVLAAAAAPRAAITRPAEVVPIGQAPSVRPPAARGARAWPGWLAAAAALLLAAGLGTQLRDERAARASVEGRLAQERATRAEREALLASVLAPEVRTARLTATGQGPEVRLIWNQREGVVIVTAQALSPAPAGRTYQLWGIPTGGQPQSLGLFDADSAGNARAVLRVPPNAAMDVAAITVEPSGGSPGPTTTPVMAGQIRAE